MTGERMKRPEIVKEAEWESDEEDPIKQNGWKDDNYWNIEKSHTDEQLRV